MLRSLPFTLLLACGADPKTPGTGLEPPPQGTVCLNEFSPEDDDDGDWIELHNPTDLATSLHGWHLTDDPDKPLDRPLEPSLTVEAGGYLVLFADDSPELGPTHLPFLLDNQGEAIGLFDSHGGGEVFRFGATLNGHSWARQPDCCTPIEDCVVQVTPGSPGAPNL